MLNELIGKRITEIRMSEDKEEILFLADDKWLKFLALGDCCSNSWIEHIDGVDLILNHVISETEEFETVCEEVEYGDQLQIDITRLKNENGGIATFDFRNSSNGYYSGWLEHVEGFTNDNNQIDNYKIITDDF